MVCRIAWFWYRENVKFVNNIYVSIDAPRRISLDCPLFRATLKVQQGFDILRKAFLYTWDSRTLVSTASPYTQVVTRVSFLYLCFHVNEIIGEQRQQ
jgi:hypothetical protein